MVSAVLVCDLVQCMIDTSAAYCYLLIAEVQWKAVSRDSWGSCRRECQSPKMMSGLEDVYCVSNGQAVEREDDEVSEERKSG